MENVRSYKQLNAGVWRSLVARTLGVGEAVGSNPATPIKKKASRCGVFFLDLNQVAIPTGLPPPVDIFIDLQHDGKRVIYGWRMHIMESTQSDYFVVKAKENGVQVIGLTRGQDTRFHHTEKLDKGEVMIAQFTDHTSAVKIRGKAILYTKYGTIETEV
jgi:transcription attenuation protein (tryptophan RNA-binding attenuator protein)